VGAPDYEPLADRLERATAQAFVGRGRELALLGTWTAGDAAPAVVFLHGPPGIGKTALVRAFAAARPPGDVVVLDGHALEPTPSSVLATLGAVSGAAPEAASIGAALAERASCLVVDGAERLTLLDSWLRNELLPALPARLTTVISGRRRPSAAWLTAPGWQSLVAELPLGPLSATDASTLLRSLDVAGDLRATLRFARGHPLALRLAAAVPGAVDSTPGLPSAIEHLVDRFLDGLTLEDVRLVQAATTLRRVTESDLRILLDGDDAPDDAWRRLRDLPFADLGADGLELHEVVRDAVQLSLARRDPLQHRVLRARAVDAVRSRVAQSPPGWSSTADLLYLVPDRIVRDGFFPPEGEAVPVDDATDRDRAAIHALVERCDGGEASRHTTAWFDAHPRSLRVARAPDGTPIGVQSAVERADADPWLLRADPVAAHFATHLDRHPLPAGATALFVRRTLAEDGETPTPALASLFIDVKRTYMELRPQLQRVYLGTSHDDLRLVEHLGFGEIGTAVVDGTTHRALLLDLGPDSIDGWLAGLLDTGMAVPRRPARAASPLDQLTDREREVLALVADGATNKDIAATLGISVKTVSRHLESTFAKLAVANRAAAARIATAHGLVR
jgi:DNA-binding CsgD family transcriptional regulator